MLKKFASAIFVTEHSNYMDNKKNSICLIAFSLICRDARVLRQIKYLSPHFDLRIIGYGPPYRDWANKDNVNWFLIEFANFPNNETSKLNKKRKVFQLLMSIWSRYWILKVFFSIVRKFKIILSFSLLGLGRIHTWFYEIWYWKRKYRLKILQYAIQSGSHVFHANDWEALPIAAKAAKMNHAKVIFDAHEYAPLELENRRYWKYLFRPAIIYFIKKYAPLVNASVTVAPIISERYQKEFGLDAIVILNTPEMEPLKVKKINFDNIRLVHHGGAIRDRRLENLIETLAFCDKRFSLHLILLNNDLNYLRKLKKLAEKRVPGRVMFHDPVSPDEIVRRISEYDIGFCLIAPTNFNYLISLPNKFFDYVMAGLAVCVGPSPSMAGMVRQYGFGCVAPSFDPQHVAETLNRLTTEELSRMQSASLKAAPKINAEKEMKKLVDLYNQLFNKNGCCVISDGIHDRIPS
jgi:glycosyltransferase involved in cell wall biosynthesis